MLGFTLWFHGQSAAHNLKKQKIKKYYTVLSAKFITVKYKYEKSVQNLASFISRFTLS